LRVVETVVEGLETPGQLEPQLEETQIVMQQKYERGCLDWHRCL
jgi:hypothetical protein